LGDIEKGSLKGYRELRFLKDCYAIGAKVPTYRAGDVAWLQPSLAEPLVRKEIAQFVNSKLRLKEARPRPELLPREPPPTAVNGWRAAIKAAEAHIRLNHERIVEWRECIRICKEHLRAGTAWPPSEPIPEEPVGPVVTFQVGSERFRMRFEFPPPEKDPNTREVWVKEFEQTQQALEKRRADYQRRKRNRKKL
jgi:hypothetical protein